MSAAAERLPPASAAAATPTMTALSPSAYGTGVSPSCRPPQASLCSRVISARSVCRSASVACVFRSVRTDSARCWARCASVRHDDARRRQWAARSSSARASCSHSGSSGRSALRSSVRPVCAFRSLTIRPLRSSERIARLKAASARARRSRSWTVADAISPFDETRARGKASARASSRGVKPPWRLNTSRIAISTRPNLGLETDLIASTEPARDRPGEMLRDDKARSSSR